MVGTIIEAQQLRALRVEQVIDGEGKRNHEQGGQVVRIEKRARVDRHPASTLDAQDDAHQYECSGRKGKRAHDAPRVLMSCTKRDDDEIDHHRAAPDIDDEFHAAARPKADDRRRHHDP